MIRFDELNALGEIETKIVRDLNFVDDLNNETAKQFHYWTFVEAT